MGDAQLCFEIFMDTNSNSKISTKLAGFTLIELIVSVSIMFTVAAMGFFVLRNQLLGTLDNSAEIIATRLEGAQSLAIAGASSSAWGVRFNNVTTSTPLYAYFMGPTYVAATQTFYLPGGIEFQSPAAGTTTDVVFSELSGNSSVSTTIIIRLKSDTAKTRTIRISGKGKITTEY